MKDFSGIKIKLEIQNIKCQKEVGIWGWGDIF